MDVTLRTIVAVVALALVAQTTSYREEIEKYRSNLEAELTAENGWLTVVGLFWLRPGPNVAGSAASSDLVLPAKAPARLGVFELIGDSVTFTADPSATVSVGSRRVRTHRMALRGGDAAALAAGDLRLLLIRRSGRFAIRLRDVESEARRAFDGLDYYPIRPAWRIEATFVPYSTPRKLPILNVLGQTPEMESPGYVRFTVDGQALRLDAVYESDERTDLFFIFRDQTSRDTTYPAGRYLHAPLPDNGRVVLDFNKAYNPPCAYTDYATCPLPPKQNELPIRIEAGGLAYHPTK